MNLSAGCADAPHSAVHVGSSHVPLTGSETEEASFGAGQKAGQGIARHSPPGSGYTPVASSLRVRRRNAATSRRVM